MLDRVKGSASLCASLSNESQDTEPAVGGWILIDRQIENRWMLMIG
jgi:hypothetical protein